MSHWGKFIASNVIIILIYLIYKKIEEKYKIYINCTKRTQITNLNESWPFKDSTIIEIIYATLLGDGQAEKRKNGKGTRISFYQENSHEDYLMYLHSLIANLGYCNTKKPKIETRLGNKGKIRKIIRFTTWTYDQFNNIHKVWYIDQPLGGYIKILPSNLDKYLTPLALSIWIMDDGGKLGSGLKLSTNNFTLKENQHLIYLLKSLYNIESTIHKTGVIDQYNIYILSTSMPVLVKLVKPYIIPSMKYKLGKYI